MSTAPFARHEICQRFWLRLLAAAFGVLAALATAAHAAPSQPLRFGVFPYLPPLTLDRMFQPIVADLSGALGRPVHFRTKSTFSRYRAALANASYDLILVHPFFYTFAADVAGYQPIARLDQDLVAVLVAPPGAPKGGLAGLRGRVIGLPDPLSAVSILIHAALAGEDLLPGRDLTLRHFQSKASCLHAAAVGDVDACAVPRFVLRQLEVDDELGLETIYEAPPVPHFVLAAHPRVSLPECRSILRTVLAWSRTEGGARMLAARGWHGFLPATEADYRGIRAIEEQTLRIMMRH